MNATSFYCMDGNQIERQNKRSASATQRRHYYYSVGQIKRHHFTFLLVTNECINKILSFLA